MYISKKLPSTLIIAALLFAMIMVGWVRPFVDEVVLLAFSIALFITVLVINWISSEPKQTQSLHKVEKVLRELDDDDLDLLRSRLMQKEQNGDYDYRWMAELVQSGKRKNEVR